jgi:hypothetical protein
LTNYFTATKSPGLTVYRTFDPVVTALLCFRHSTGPVTLTTGLRVQPDEPGVLCESCHGPGRAHAEIHGSEPIQNRKRRCVLLTSGWSGNPAIRTKNGVYGMYIARDIAANSVL